MKDVGDAHHRVDRGGDAPVLIAADPLGVDVGGHSLAYDFGDATGCPMNNAGRNTNRRAVTDNGATTTYCYDAADRLVSSSDAAVGTPAYDAHANTTTLGTQALAHDGADRHVATADGATAVTYVRDATDRILERKVAGATVAPYGYAGPRRQPEVGQLRPAALRPAAHLPPHRRRALRQGRAQRRPAGATPTCTAT